MRERKKRSLVWQIDSEKFKEIVKHQNSLSGVLKEIGVVFGGGGVLAVKKRCEKENIDYTHIPIGLGHNKGISRGGINAFPLEDVMVENSKYSRGHLKIRLLKDKILEEKCAKCESKPKWQGEKLVLILDHINGIHNDNRLENLRLLCPNCNSQTETFAGRNKKYKEVKTKLIKVKQYRVCTKCPAAISQKSKSGLCRKCYFEIFRRTTVRPKKEILVRKVESQGYRATSREYGVSDNTIRKWIDAP
jgi:Zn finger protein HypA/HybF involved in hydrogenase expression